MHFNRNCENIYCPPPPIIMLQKQQHQNENYNYQADIHYFISGSSDAILCLVNGLATVEAYDNDGLTALHCAASRGHHECIDTLIGLCGAEVDVIDQNGSTPLFYAVTLGMVSYEMSITTIFGHNNLKLNTILLVI